MLDGAHPLDMTGLLAIMLMLGCDTLGCICFYLAFRAPEEAFTPTKPCLVPPHHEVQVSPAVSRSLTFTPIMKWMAHLFRGTQDSLQITSKTYWNKHKCTVSLRCFHQTTRHTEEGKKVIQPNRTSYFPIHAYQPITYKTINNTVFAVQCSQLKDGSLLWLHIGNNLQTNHKVCQPLSQCAMDTLIAKFILLI